MRNETASEIAVIIPTYNRVGILRECLEALAKQELHGAAMEVIVGDDGSTDGTSVLLEVVGPKMPYRLTWFSQRNAGQNAVRNRAIHLTSAPLLLFFNDDTIASPSLVYRHLDAHRRYPDEQVAFLGKVTIDPSLPRSPFALLHLDSSFARWDRLLGPASEGWLDWRAFYTCNLSVKRSLLMRCGLFDEDIRYSDDVELGARLHRHGLRVLYCPDAIGYHRHFLTEEAYLGIARNEGEGLARWYRKNPMDRESLEAMGFPLYVSPLRRLRYGVGDLLFHRRWRTWWIRLARTFITSHEKLALRLYEKLYQAIKRETVVMCLKNERGEV